MCDGGWLTEYEGMAQLAGDKVEAWIQRGGPSEWWKFKREGGDGDGQVNGLRQSTSELDLTFSEPTTTSSAVSTEISSAWLAQRSVMAGVTFLGLILIAGSWLLLLWVFLAGGSTYKMQAADISSATYTRVTRPSSCRLPPSQGHRNTTRTGGFSGHYTTRPSGFPPSR